MFGESERSFNRGTIPIAQLNKLLLEEEGYLKPKTDFEQTKTA